MITIQRQQQKQQQQLSSNATPWRIFILCTLLLLVGTILHVSFVPNRQVFRSNPFDSHSFLNRFLHEQQQEQQQQQQQQQQQLVEENHHDSSSDTSSSPSIDFTNTANTATASVVVASEYTLFPLSLRDLLGFTLAMMGLFMAAGGGIGGGGLLVPIYILILRIDPKHAIPLSNITVFGGAVANTIFNWNKRHPHVDRPMMDWDLVYVMEPMTMVGAILGVHLNKVLPEIFIVLLLLIVLVLTATKTLKKATDLYRKEQFQKLPQKDQDRKNDEEAIDKTNSQVTDTVTVTIPTNQSSPENQTSNEIELPGVIDEKEQTTNSHTTISDRDSSSTNQQQHSQNERVQITPVQVHLQSNGANNPHNEVFQDEIDDMPYESSNNNASTTMPHHHPKKQEKQQKNPRSHRGTLYQPNKYVQLKSTTTTANTVVNGSEEDATLQKLMEQERRPPFRNVFIIVGMFLTVLCINILKGGGGFVSPIGIGCGSLMFWIAELSIFLLVLGVSWDARNYLLQKQSLKTSCNYPLVEGDILWDERSTVLYPLLCCFAGFVAGLFGIGGGIVKGPIMLALGVHPSVASASSALMILFTSFTATTSFAVFGLLLQDYALFCLVMGFSATVLGQTAMNYLLKKYQRHSYVAFCIGAVVALSAAAMSVESIISLIEVSSRSNLSHSQHQNGICGHHFQ